MSALKSNVPEAEWIWWFVFEMKVSGTAQDALAQIDDKGYAIPYQTVDRNVVKIGVKFDVDTRTPEEWAIE